MNKYVYIRYEDPDRYSGIQRLYINHNFDKLIECISVKYYGDNKCTKKAKKLIKKESNRLLNVKKSFDGVTNSMLKVYSKVTLKQISSLRRPKSGYTTCYAVIVVMAIFNLLTDGSPLTGDFALKSLCNDENLSFLEFCLMEQCNDIKSAYNRRLGALGLVGHHQYMLARYHSVACTTFEDHFDDKTYTHIVDSICPKNIFRGTVDVPDMKLLT